MKLNIEISNRVLFGVGSVVAAFFVGRLGAQEATEAPQWVYSGVLTDDAGRPRASVDELSLGFFRAPSGGDALCEQVVERLDLSTTQGRFRVALDDCSGVIEANDGLYVEAVVDGVRLPRQKMGASAYALRARQSESAGVARFADEAARAIRVADGVVNSASLAGGAVRSQALAPRAVTTEKLADASVTVNKLADSSVRTEKLADASVTTSKLVDGSVTANKLAAGSIGFDRVANVPADLRDGDDDTLAALDCVDGEIPRWDDVRGTWLCDIDVDTRLSDAEVVAVLANKDVHVARLQAGATTSLSAGRLDLGPDANDQLTAAMVRSLAGGGNADALHTHAGLGAGGVCYTAWGLSTCASGFSVAYAGKTVWPGISTPQISAPQFCYGGPRLREATSAKVLLLALGEAPDLGGAAEFYRSGLSGDCVVCCK